MINYEKIKSGKKLTANQKRIRDVYLKHQLNLEGQELRKRDYLEGKRVRLHELNFYISCSRGVENVYIAYDNTQKENIRVVTKESENWDSYAYNYKYPKLADIVYIILGPKNIKGWDSGRCGLYDGILSLYDNKGKYGTCHISINHRKNIEINCDITKCVLEKRKFDGKMFYSHGRNKADALNGLHIKIKNYLKEKKNKKREEIYNRFFSNLKFNTIIDVKRYRALTGACQFGCERFANREHLDINARLKVSDLLRYLQPSDYGYHRLVSALGI